MFVSKSKSKECYLQLKKVETNIHVALGPNPTRQGILRHDLFVGTTPSNFIVVEYARSIRHSERLTKKIEYS